MKAFLKPKLFSPITSTIFPNSYMPKSKLILKGGFRSANQPIFVMLKKHIVKFRDFKSKYHIKSKMIFQFIHILPISKHIFLYFKKTLTKSVS